MGEEKAPPGADGEKPGVGEKEAAGKEGGEGGWRIPGATYGAKKTGESGKVPWAGGDYKDQKGKSKEAKTEKEFEVGPAYQKEYKPTASKTWGTEKPDEVGEKDKTYAAVLQRKASVEVLSASFNPEEKKAKLTVLDAKVEIALLHAQVGGQWDPALVLRDLLIGKDEPAPAAAKPPSMVPMAARLSDPTGHFMFPLAPGPGSPNVFIGGMPAWRAGLDVHICAAPGGHGGGPVTPGAPTVFINGFPAARATDFVVEPMGGPDPVVMGCPTVLIGTATAAPVPAAPKTGLFKRIVGAVLDAVAGWVLFEAGASGDVAKASAEGKIAGEVSVKDKKATAEAKGAIGVVSAAGSIPLKLRVKVPWTDQYVGMGLTVEGTGPGLGAEGAADAKINDGKTFFHVGAGAKVSPGPAGLGLKASLDISKR